MLSSVSSKVEIAKFNHVQVKNSKVQNEQAEAVAREFTAGFYYKVLEQIHSHQPKTSLSGEDGNAMKIYNQMLNMVFAEQMANSSVGEKLNHQIAAKLYAKGGQ